MKNLPELETEEQSDGVRDYKEGQLKFSESAVRLIKKKFPRSRTPQSIKAYIESKYPVFKVVEVKTDSLNRYFAIVRKYDESTPS